MTRLLMAVRDDEAEPVIVERDGDLVVLILDDECRLTFDHADLESAINDDTDGIRDAA